MHDAVTAAWDKVTEDWDNQARHDALLALAAENQAFKWVATKYRERKGDPIADAQLTKIGAAAMATMFASATAKREKSASPYKRALVWMVVFVILMVFGLVAVKLMAMSHHTPPP